MARRGGGRLTAVTERDHTGGGGLTGATGDLTFEENDRPFVTGESQEIGDPARRADVTAAQIRRAPAQHGDTGDVTDRPEGGLTNMATRDDGYASKAGLNPEDPAYRMERHLSAGEQGGDPARASAGRDGSEVRIGGDELTNRDEHL
jgi:hypothetical protein